LPIFDLKDKELLKAASGTEKYMDFWGKYPIDLA